MKSDKFYMRRAIELAKKAEGKTSPNPIVGCVIVKNNKILAEGYHKKAGMPHAEIEALRKIPEVKGATMYVTLEPCDHYGKTPPCTDEVIKRGIKKVIIAMKDPHGINNGKGIKKLRNKNIAVRLGLLAEEAKKMYGPYTKFITKKLPFVTVKIAESLDGKIAAHTGDSKWISNDLSRNFVRNLRSRVDAVMVGINTVLKDDPLLLPKGLSNALTRRVVIDSDLRIPVNSRLVKTIKYSPLIIAATSMASREKAKVLARKGALIVTTEPKNNKVDLWSFLRLAANMGIMHIMVEGGGKLVGSLFDEKLVDRVLFFIAPKIIGGDKARPSVGGIGIKTIGSAIRLKNIEIKNFRDDILVTGDVVYDGKRSR